MTTFSEKAADLLYIKYFKQMQISEQIWDILAEFYVGRMPLWI